MLDSVNRWGAIITLIIYGSGCLVFVFRLLRRPRLARWMGFIFMLMAVPLVGLLATAPGLGRSWLYYLQIGLMLAFQGVVALLDYILKVAFRHERWKVIGFVMLFFAGTGGMLGVAALAGSGWIMTAGVLFLVMAVLAFVQRAVTGL